MISPERGPRRVLCVVVVVTSAMSMGLGIEPGGDQSCDMGDVGDEIGPDAVGDVPEALPVEHPRVGRKAGHDELRFVLKREPFRLIVVDLSGLGVQPVLDCLIIFCRRR